MLVETDIRGQCWRADLREIATQGAKVLPCGRACTGLRGTDVHIKRASLRKRRGRHCDIFTVNGARCVLGDHPGNAYVVPLTPLTRKDNRAVSVAPIPGFAAD